MSGYSCSDCHGESVCLCRIADRMDAAPNSPNRRERIATAVLAGMASDAGVRWDVPGSCLAPSRYAGRAIEWADALIAELDR